MSNELWSIITLIALFGWLTSTIMFLFKAFPERGLFMARPARVWGAAMLFCYGVWVVGLLNA